ncbi:MAG TPA: hypothetical protein VGH20_21240 [Myxococcales bacterium]|jgi:hypothetical protein
MFDDLLPSGDPLRHIDPRYEPLDPLFDVDEPDLPPIVAGKRRRKLQGTVELRQLVAATAEGDPKPRAME